jgi:hypothetical protein
MNLRFELDQNMMDFNPFCAEYSHKKVVFVHFCGSFLFPLFKNFKLMSPTVM